MEKEIIQREKFLSKSLETLEKKQVDLNELMQKKIAEIQHDVMMARRLRKENLLVSPEIKVNLSSDDEFVKKEAEDGIKNLQLQENQIVQKYIQEAVNHPEKGKEIRSIAQQIRENNLRITQIKTELERIKASSQN